MKKNNFGVVLTYNSASTLVQTIKKIPKNCLSRIIVVDDGSTDDTIVRAKLIGIKVFTHRHGGYGANLKSGLKKAVLMGANYIVEIHGDGQYDPAVIPSAIKKAERENIDLLLGSRFTNRAGVLKKMPKERYYANKILSTVNNFVFGLNLTEFHTGFRVYSRKLVESAGFKNTSNDYIYSFEIISQAKFLGLKIDEIPIDFNYDEGHTSINLIKGVIYFFHTFYIMGLYILALAGLRLGIFEF